MSASAGRCGAGGAGGGGGGHDEVRRAWICSVGAKRRAAWKWTNSNLAPPPSLSDYAPGGAYYDEMPEMPADYAPPQAAYAPPPADYGEGSSSGAARGAAVLLYARDDDEERAAVAMSEASLADELEAERQEAACAIAAVKAFERQEAAKRRKIVFLV